jgi:hypothetical protein
VQGVSGAGEDGEEAVSFAVFLDQRAAMLVDDFFRQGVVTGEGGAHRLRVFLPEPCAALDVRQQEGDGSGRQVRHRRTL